MSDPVPPVNTPPSWTSTRARIAQFVGANPDREVPDELRRDHAAARLEDHVRRVVDAAPPLTDEQRERISAALAPSVRATLA